MLPTVKRLDTSSKCPAIVLMHFSVYHDDGFKGTHNHPTPSSPLWWTYRKIPNTNDFITRPGDYIGSREDKRLDPVGMLERGAHFPRTQVPTAYGIVSGSYRFFQLDRMRGQAHANIPDQMYSDSSSSGR